jgi:hypothetical protein
MQLQFWTNGQNEELFLSSPKHMGLGAPMWKGLLSPLHPTTGSWNCLSLSHDFWLCRLRSLGFQEKVLEVETVAYSLRNCTPPNAKKGLSVPGKITSMILSEG